MSAAPAGKAADKLGVLVSGGGTNLQSIIDNIHFGSCHAGIACVVSNVAGAHALTRAARAGIPHYAIPHTDYKNRNAFESALIKVFNRHAVNSVILAGFMRVLEAAFIDRYAGRILNIHPSLLPKYPGLNTHQRAIDQRDQQHGCSVHFATIELDGGPLILQAGVPVLANDNAATLAKRVSAKEHIIYPLCIQWLCEGRLHYQDGAAYFNGKALEEPLQLEKITCETT